MDTFSVRICINIHFLVVVTTLTYRVRTEIVIALDISFSSVSKMATPDYRKRRSTAKSSLTKVITQIQLRNLLSLVIETDTLLIICLNSYSRQKMLTQVTMSHWSLILLKKKTIIMTSLNLRMMHGYALVT